MKRFSALLLVCLFPVLIHAQYVNGLCKKGDVPPEEGIESSGTQGVAYSDEFLRQVASVDTRFAATLWAIRRYPQVPIMVKWFDVPISQEDFELLLSGESANIKAFHLSLQKNITDSTPILDYKVSKSVDKQAGKIFLTIEAPVSEKGHTILELTLDTKLNKNRTQDVLSWNIR